MPKLVHDQFYGLKNIELATHSMNGLLVLELPTGQGMVIKHG